MQEESQIGIISKDQQSEKTKFNISVSKVKKTGVMLKNATH